MIKALKISASIIVILLLLYGASFLFSNTGLSPSDESRNLQGQFNTPKDKESSFAISEQDLPEVKASSFEVTNLTSKTVLVSRRPDSALLVASLTKLMTTWIVVNFGDLEDQYQIATGDSKSFSPSLGLVTGDTVQVSDLLNSMLIGSANDAALALSHYVEKKQSKSFLELMNSEAKNLSLNDTRFSNPNGFDSDTNYSSAHDIKTLATKLYERHIFDNTSRSSSYSFSGALQKTYHVNATNQLLVKYKDLYAIKTGFTNEAQGSMVTILKYNQNEYLLIVLGSPDREADTLKLRQLIIDSKLSNL